MLKYKRISSENGRTRYEFYPSGDVSAPGIVEFKEGKTPVIIQQSEKDVKMYFATHALNGIDPTKESGTVAWH